MYLLVLFSPLLSFLISLLFGKIIGSHGVSFISILALFTALCSGFYLYYEVSLSGYLCIINFYKFIDLGYFNLDIVFFFDVLTSVMIIVVLSISFLVHLYSIEYMNSDPCFNRFMGYLSIFTFFMLLLVTSDNFLQMFIG
jgi:NADH:ubiquinone oxidoreductase subunit 5 (subunit L)/multisubunit Na+/H+ antiporter MnhA subunit